ncbi:RNA polymerase sigma factor [Marivibrio halodurans]|uniref:RNA polymerase sigma factor n=1 Tax=Marivibrio halodurans TaxID=2039722 RepID=UPI0031BB940E
MPDLRGRLQDQAARLYGYAMALTRNPEDAEDLVQETFIKAMTADRHPADAAAFRAWLFRILRNLFLDQRRWAARAEAYRQAVRDAASDGELSDTTHPGRKDAAAITILTVRFGLMKLAPHQREILALIDVAGFSYAEASDLLDVPIGTVMSRISRARAHLIAAIDDSNIVPLPTRSGRS